MPNVLMPPLMNNHGNIIGSLGNVARYLGEPGRGARRRDLSRLCRNRRGLREDGAVDGVATATWASAATVSGRHYFPRAWSFGKYTVFAEGARGSLAKQLIARFNLRKPLGAEVRHRHQGTLAGTARRNSRKGYVQHTFGWPLDNEDRRRLVPLPFRRQPCDLGLVVHLNYKNPSLSPFEEFQRFRLIPRIREILEGGTRRRTAPAP